METQTIDIWSDPLLGDAQALRRAFGSFATGVTVVATSTVDGECRAFTANSFTSVSLDPPLVLVCLGKFSASLEVFERAENFSISILEAGQRGISSAFASRDARVKIAAAAQLVTDVAPYVPDSLATFMCSRHQLIDAGDHLILIGRVERYRSTEAQPLGFFRGGYVGLGADVSDIERLRATVTVGGVLGHGGKLFLCRRPGSTDWEIPSVTLARGEGHGTALEKLFASLGAEVSMSVPYSLFQEIDEQDMTLIFSVESQGDFKTGTLPDGTTTALFGQSDAPWSLIRGEMKRALLQRYLRETASGLYSVYFDTPGGGSVVALNGRPQAWSELGL